MDNKVVIHWFRKDLRLTDNTSLLAAASAGKVVPVYLLSTWRGEHRWTGSKRQTFLCHCLRDLAISLERVGSRLILRSGSAVEEIPRLACEVGAIEVHTNRDYDLYGKKIEQKLQNILSSQGVVFKTHKDSVIWEGREILTINGEPFRVFTPYSRAWRNACFSNNFRPAPERLPAPDFLFQLHSLSLPTPAYWNLPDETENILPGGETQARRRLEDFFNSGKIFEYSNKRDFPALEATSRFSQDLRFGLISIREIFQRCQKASISSPKTALESVHKFETELIWREFYFQILYNFPEVLEVEFNPKYRNLTWPGSLQHFECWKFGQTGFPLVDAGMRQLLKTGFMHNRVRMISAMFLTKDLHLDWRLGEQWFLQHLVDGEIASNNGGWQWSAGTGADAAPYFRIHNPWLQTKKFDPKGDYIRQWLPELQNVPTEKFFSPPPQGQSLAPSYPRPIVDHNEERIKALSFFA